MFLTESWAEFGRHSCFKTADSVSGHLPFAVTVDWNDLEYICAKCFPFEAYTEFANVSKALRAWESQRGLLMGSHAVFVKSRLCIATLAHLTSSHLDARESLALYNRQLEGRTARTVFATLCVFDGRHVNNLAGIPDLNINLTHAAYTAVQTIQREAFSSMKDVLVPRRDMMYIGKVLGPGTCVVRVVRDCSVLMSRPKHFDPRGW